jgi:hypothetical protein
MAKGGWRPRHGERLPTGWPFPGRAQKVAHLVLAKIPPKLLHPVWGIVVATALAITGRSELAFHSYGLLAAILWLIVDLWAWLLENRSRWHWRFALGAGSTSALLIVVMGVMWWWLDGKLQDQREDVWKHLTAGHYVPLGSEDDPMHTMFSVTNGGSYTISRRREIVCLTNLSVGNNGTSRVESIASAFNNGRMQMGGIDAFPWDRSEATSALESGGDAETQPCLEFYEFKNGTDCADVTLVFRYSLDNQPSTAQERKFRFVAYKSKTGAFSWYQQPVEASERYCHRYLKPK